MGYYTRHTLTVFHGDPAVEDAIVKAIKELTEYSFPFDDSCKWYDCEEDCAAVSKQFPGVLFAVDGEGEEVGDKWRCFFKDGESEMHKMPEWTPPEKPTAL